jgi:CheY-like chemotaxis protein
MSNPRVLVVDDDQVIATTTSMSLSASGFESIAAFDGHQALAIARVQHFDLLLTDVMMEPLNGIQLALAFLQIHPAAQVLLISGTVESALPLLDAEHSGHVFPLLQKPIHPRALVDRLSVALQTSGGTEVV